MCALIDLRDSYHGSVDALRSLHQLHASSLSHTQRELTLLSELRRLHERRQTALQQRAPDVDAKAKQIPYFQVKKKEYDRDVHEIEVRNDTTRTVTRQQSRLRSSSAAVGRSAPPCSVSRCVHSQLLILLDRTCAFV